jgi:glyoxylase-like metal-dependent hydrolase (beta-lactamase superfamily II)
MVDVGALRVEVLDTLQFGRPRAGCAYLLREEKTALIDTGTAANAPRLLESLQGSRVDFAFVTHVHLDHAGAAGHIARAHPETTFVAHPRAVPHLADPSHLIAGVAAASSDLAPLYGVPLPVPQDRLVAAEDGDSFALGSEARLVVVATPGHAPHHVCFFEPVSGTLFLGDAAGHHAVSVGLPLTVPPRFDLAAGRASIVRLLDLRPRTLAFSHFGLAEGASDLLASYPRGVEEWLNHVRDLRERVGEELVADAVLDESRHEGLSSIDRDLVRLCVRGALATLTMGARPNEAGGGPR